MTEYYVVSRRASLGWPGQGCLVEFEDVLVDCCDGRLLCPVFTNSRRPRLVVDVPARQTSADQVLFLAGISQDTIPKVLAAIPDWRSRFDLVCAYILDAFPYRTEVDKPDWRRRISRFSRACAAIDHLFIPVTGSIATYQRLYGMPVSLVPMACDVLRFGSGDPTSRSIDVMGYGRQHPGHSRQIAEAYNRPSSPRFYYHTDHMRIESVHDFHQHRQFFWKLLTRSRIGLAYDALVVNPSNRFPFSFVSQRWFEMLAAGCLIVGRRPTCPEADELLDWVDATVEVPEADDEVIPFLESLLADHERLDAAHRRNYAQSLTRHDWRLRIADMLGRLGLDHPQALKQQLERLHERTATLVG